MEVVKRPKIRADCIRGLRPCPWVRCKHHMIWAFPKLCNCNVYKIVKEIFKLKETCVLDVADLGGMTLEEIGEILGTTRERVRQLIEARGNATNRAQGAILRLRHYSRSRLLKEFTEEETPDYEVRHIGRGYGYAVEGGEEESEGQEPTWH